MPKRKGGGHKKTSKSLKVDSTAANEIAELTQRQALEMIIDDFEVQVPRIIETACRRFERECGKLIRQLPDKTSLPPEIYSINLQDFIDSGGSVDESMKTLREKKRKEFDEETSVMKDTLEPCKENNDPDNNDPTIEGLTTPAIRTRSHIAMTTQSRKRKPNQLEQVKMVALSKDTGSPVDERHVMENVIDDMVQGLMTSILPQIKSKAAKSQASKAIESSLTALKAEFRKKSEVSLVTPSIGSTRGKRRFK